MNRFRRGMALIARIPNAWSLLLLILLAGLAEGIGISVLVPMVSSMTGEFSKEGLPPPFNLLPDGLQAIGIEPNFDAMLLLALLTMVSAFLLIHVQERAVYRARYRFMDKLRNHAGQAIFGARWERIASLSSGDLANQIIHESDRGSEALISLMSMLAVIVQMIVYAIFALLLSWQMFLVAFATFLIGAITARRLIRMVRTLGMRSAEINSYYSRQMVDYVRGAKLLKATGTEQRMVKKLGESSHTACNTLRRIVVNRSLMRFELQSIISIAMVAILYLAITVLDVQVSVLLVFLFIVMRLAPRFSTFQGQYHNYSAFSPALDVVDRLIRESEKLAEPVYLGGQVFDGLSQGIVLSGVSYRYPEADSNAIKDLSLSIGNRDFVALVGKSGSGKSTALDLIMGLIDSHDGTLLLDGVPLNDYDRRSYRQKIGFVSQDSVFFTGTVRENLCLDDSCDEQVIWSSLGVAQIDGFVRQLPEGLDTAVGESGVKLSGGQRQRLAIARALIRQPSLLVLDEATSALDSESETRFQHAIESVAQEYTVVVVAHRLATVRKADCIYVMEEGRIVQSGNYASLRQTDGVFSDLVKAQAVLGSA